MDRSTILRVLGACFSLWPLVLSAQPGSRDLDHPDVLFIAVDDLNTWISLYDPDSAIRTPNLERLASRGALFTRAYCASPACNPSRVATLTGLRPTTSGVYGNKSDWRKALPKHPTIMQRFRSAGYEVKGAGKIFHHHLDGAFHDEASFDDFQPMAPQNMPPEKLNGAPEYGSRNTDWGKWPEEEQDTIDFKTADYCIATLRSPPPGRPLFLACGIFTRWRYIRYSDGSEELYDHESDPHEWTNLAEDPAFAEVIGDHRRWIFSEEAESIADLKPEK